MPNSIPKTDASHYLHSVAHFGALTDTFSSPTRNNFCHDGGGSGGMRERKNGADSQRPLVIKMMDA
jgi:hypothetical protein